MVRIPVEGSAPCGIRLTWQNVTWITAVMNGVCVSPSTMRNTTVLISGGSRGIGLAIAKRLAEDGANIVLLAKTAEPHPKLPGTVYSAAEELRTAGGQALPVRSEERRVGKERRSSSAQHR